MKFYKVEVTEYGEKQGDDRYPPSKTIYTQLFDGLNLKALIAVVNGLRGPRAIDWVTHDSTGEAE